MNPHKGEVSFEADGKRYTLRYSIDAICALEGETGKSIVSLLSEFEDPTKITLTHARLMMWAGLREHHPDIQIKEAGELILAAGGLIKFIKVLNEAFKASFGVGDKKPNPRKAGGPNGTGPRSSSSGRVSADRQKNSGSAPRAS